MKSAILCFPGLEWGQVQMPIGLYKIAGYCAEKYDVIIVDSRLTDAQQKIKEILDTRDVLCVGFSVMIGSQIADARKLSKIFCGTIPIVWGGALPTMLPEITLQETFVDFIIRGDGEDAFFQLLEYLSGRTASPPSDQVVHCLSDIYKGIHYDTVEIPNNYFIKRDGLEKAIAIETSRGCPHQCSFCHNTFLGHPYRALPVEAIMKSIDHLQKRFCVDGVVFQEDNLFFNRNRATNTIKALADMPGIKWKANSRIDYFKQLVQNQPYMDMLTSSGCTVLQFGVESGSNRVLKTLAKNITVSDVLFVNRKLASYPIRIRYNFIIGFPFETREEVQSTIDLAQLLVRENPFTEPPFINIYTPLPNTPLYNLALADGFSPPESLDEWATITWNNCDFERWPRKINSFLNDISKQALSANLYLK